MRIEYLCKHCKHLVGEIHRPEWSYEEAERMIGLSHLSPVERSESIAYNNNRDVLYVETVCDYCQSAVESQPELLIEGKLLQ